MITCTVDLVFSSCIIRPSKIALGLASTLTSMTHVLSSAQNLSPFRDRIADVESEVEYTIERCTKQDYMFMKKVRKVLSLAPIS